MAMLTTNILGCSDPHVDDPPSPFIPPNPSIPDPEVAWGFVDVPCSAHGNTNASVQAYEDPRLLVVYLSDSLGNQTEHADLTNDDLEELRRLGDAVVAASTPEPCDETLPGTEAMFAGGMWANLRGCESDVVDEFRAVFIALVSTRTGIDITCDCLVGGCN